MERLERRWLILFEVLLCTPPLRAQVDTLWTRRYGGEAWDFGESVRQTTDGGFIIAGATGVDVMHNSDIYLIKTDGSGNEQWTTMIGRSITVGEDASSCVIQTADGGFVITGHTSLPDENALWQVYLVKTDADGDTVWTRTFGGPLSEHGTCVQGTSDDGYIVTGWTYSYGEGGLDVFLLKTDSLGHPDWMKTYGGPYDDAGYSVQQTEDGGFVVGGYTRSSSGGGFADLCLIKTDSNGNSEWEKTFGGDWEDLGYSVCRTSDGGYLLGGSTESFGAGGSDVYLVKTDASGNSLWTRTFGGWGDDAGFSLIETREGAFVVVGKTNSFGIGDQDMYLIKTDESGTELWSFVFGANLDEIGRSVQETSDGGFVIAGNIGSYSQEIWDVLLMETTTDAVSVGNDLPSIPVPRAVILHPNYPNPFNPLTTISFDLPEAPEGCRNVALDIYDLRGKLIRSLFGADLGPGRYHVIWDGRDENGAKVSSGMYLYSLKTGDDIHTRKMTVMK